MRRNALLVSVTTAAAIVFVTLATMLSTRPHEPTGRPPPQQEPVPRPPPPTDPAPTSLGIVSEGALTRLDPGTLQPRPPRVLLGEYHHAWSFSPDRTELALAISSPGQDDAPVVGDRGRVGIRIVDLQRMKADRDISTGVAAEALGWLASRRLVAILQSGDAIVVEPVTGVVLRRWKVASAPVLGPRWIRTPDGLLVLVDAAPFPRLASFDLRGGLRVVPLERQQDGCCGPWSKRAGLTLDTKRERAFVVAAGAPVAEVDLRTLRVRYHQVTTPGSGLLPSPGTIGQEALWASRRQALWLGADKLAVFGEQRSPADAKSVASTPAGVAIVNTRSWTVRMVEARASHACLAAGRLLVYHGDPLASVPGSGIGLRVHALDGRQLRHLFDNDPVSHIEVHRHHAYVHSPAAVRVVDPRSGRIVRTLPTSPDIIELLGGPCEP